LLQYHRSGKLEENKTAFKNKKFQAIANARISKKREKNTPFVNGFRRNF